MTVLRPARFRFEELKIATVVFLLMLAPVAIVLALLQLWVPSAEVKRIVSTGYTTLEVPKLQLYVLYLTSAVAHIIVSVLVILFLRQRLRQNISAPKRSTLDASMYFFVAAIVGLFLLCDSTHPVLSALSHERIYAVLGQSPIFAPYFIRIPGALFGSQSFPGFYLFSILPGGLIVLGLVVIVLTCFSLGRDLTFIRNNIKAKLAASKRHELDARIQAFHTYFYILSAVLMTSTIATALFFKLPLTSIADAEAYASFDGLSTAMAICWGVTFSLTMLAMCFYPYFRIQKDLRSLLIESKVTDDIELQRWLEDIQKNYVIYSNVKSLLSIFMPAAVGVLSRFI